jgi:hypothetical protein
MQTNKEIKIPDVTIAGKKLSFLPGRVSSLVNIGEAGRIRRAIQNDAESTPPTKLGYEIKISFLYYCLFRKFLCF